MGANAPVAGECGCVTAEAHSEPVFAVPELPFRELAPFLRF